MNTTKSTSPATVRSLAALLAKEGILDAVVATGGTCDAVVATGGACDAATLPETPVTGCACDSRDVIAGDVFCCKGAAFTPAFLERAVAQGAVAWLAETGLAREAKLAQAAPGVPALLTSDIRRAMALLSAEAYGRPDQAIPVIGITGTKGKSTVAYMLRSILDNEEPYSHAGIMGSIDTYDGVEHFESHNTTPEAPELWRHLAHARDHGLTSMVMEVSSQGLKYDRTLGVRFAVGCFLNIGRDHISPVEHPTFEDYFASKLRIFAQSDVAVVNLDTEKVDEVLAAAKASPRLVTFSATNPKADVWASDVDPGYGYVSFKAHTPRWEGEITLAMAGLFNIDNALCALAVCEVLGIPQRQATIGLAFCHVPGRMELVDSPDGRVLGLVDYAHNKLSYQRFFASVAEEFKGRKVIALFGCPGNKAQERRRELPQEAAKWADYLIYTEEDPAHERVEDICAEMAQATPAGTPYEVIPDREQAIARAVEVAYGFCDSGDEALVCLLAKGDETRQHEGDAYVDVPTDADCFTHAVRAHDLGRA